MFFRYVNYRIGTLGGHTDSIVGCFFEENTFDITTIGRNGQACVWECSVDPDDLVPFDSKVVVKKNKKQVSLLNN